MNMRNYGRCRALNCGVVLTPENVSPRRDCYCARHLPGQTVTAAPVAASSEPAAAPVAVEPDKIPDYCAQCGALLPPAAPGMQSTQAPERAANGAAPKRNRKAKAKSETAPLEATPAPVGLELPAAGEKQSKPVERPDPVAVTGDASRALPRSVLAALLSFAHPEKTRYAMDGVYRDEFGWWGTDGKTLMHVVSPWEEGKAAPQWWGRDVVAGALKGAKRSKQSPDPLVTLPVSPVGAAGVHFPPVQDVMPRSHRSACVLPEGTLAVLARLAAAEAREGGAGGFFRFGEGAVGVKPIPRSGTPRSVYEVVVALNGPAPAPCESLPIHALQATFVERVASAAGDGVPVEVLTKDQREAVVFKWTGARELVCLALVMPLALGH